MSSIRPFRFGVQHYLAFSRANWQEKARRTEELGYDTFLMPDHIGQGGIAWGPALMAAADATSTLRLGTLVLANDFRHPALLASEAATIDLLSDGRFELGIGAGWDRRDFEAAGISLDAPGVRVSRLEESLTVVKRLLTEDRVSHSGEHYAISELENAPRPCQSPRPPILVGGGGDRVLSIAAREADIVSIMPPGIGGVNGPDLSAPAMSRAIGRVRDVSVKDPRQVEISTLLQRLVITDKPDEAVRELATQWRITVEDALECPWVLFGSKEQVVEAIIQRRERFGLSYWVVPAWYMDDFAPIVAELAGK